MNRNRHNRPTRCVDGRLMRHDPQHDDPGLETDIGICPVCDGEGCNECDCCGQFGPLSRCWVTGVETFACDDCRNIR